MSTKTKILFFAILILTGVLRLYQLGQVPASVNLDEASVGYDAFSILKTGKDQFGQSFPLSFRSTNDYKLPLYIYILTPFINIFGLTAFAVRLPSAIFGIIAVYATYHLVNSISPRRNYRHRLALITSLLISTSPWHLQFSRLGVEINMAAAINILAILFFFISLKKPYFIIFSAIFFGLSLFSYHSSRLVTPVLLAILFILFHQSLNKIKHILVFFMIYAIFVILFIPVATSKKAQMRFSTMNVFDLENRLTQSAKEIQADEKNGSGFSGKIFHNRRLAIFTYDNFKKYSNNYVSHFSPNFFIEGDDNLMYHAPSFGLLYFYDLIFLMAGAVFFFIYTVKTKLKSGLFILLWFLLSPCAAAAVWIKPSSSRSLLMIPTIYILGLAQIKYNYKL